MTIENLLKLVDAGWTKEEIQTMTTPQEPQAPVEPQIPQEPQAPQAQQVAENVYKPVEPAVIPKDVSSQQIEAINALLAKVAEQTDVLRQQAIRNSDMPKPLTADDVTAQILNPYEGR